jgi:hypothetical protein
MMALGALGIIGGGVCLAWGLPYLVLEQGFTYAIIGSVLVTGGVLLIALGLLMRELRTMAGKMGGFSAQDAAAAIAAGAVAAGSAVAAGIVAGQSAAEEPKPPGKDDAQGELPLDAAHEPEPVATGAVLPEMQDPAQEPLAEPALELVPPAGDVEPAEAVPASGPALPKASAFPSFDELPAPTRGADALSLPPLDPVAPMPPAPADDEDPFERLRRSLMLGEKPVRADALAAGMTPGPRVEPAISTDLPYVEDALPSPALDDEGTGESATPEPEDHAEAVIAEAAADLAPQAAEGADEEPERDEADRPDPIEELPGTDAAAPPAVTPSAPEGPAISEEGIVSVRHIGDSTYTMYADGSVKAQTPDGVLHFASVAELKAHLANPVR